MHYDYDIVLGDPRRCPAHGCVTSSRDGLFDAPCPQCEHESWVNDLEIADLVTDWPEPQPEPRPAPPDDEIPF